jgi:hypothetical protein
MGEEVFSGGGLGRSWRTALTDHGFGLGRREVCVVLATGAGTAIHVVSQAFLTRVSGLP